MPKGLEVELELLGVKGINRCHTDGFLILWCFKFRIGGVVGCGG